MKQIKLTNDSETVVFSKLRSAANFLDMKESNLQKYIKLGKYKNWTIERVDGDSISSTTKDDEYIREKGKVTACNHNVGLFLSGAYKQFRYNEFTKDCEVNNKPVDDSFFKVTNAAMDRAIQVHDSKRLEEEVVYQCRQDVYNPLKEKLESFEWDGVKRIDDFFIKYLGASDTALNRKYTRLWFKAAVKRVYEPGCFWDTMLILQDPQHGTGKTKMFERLSLGYYCVNPDISNKDVVSYMQNSWIVNFDELAKFSSKQMNDVKTFISGNKELVRLAYQRNPEYYERHVVFCGTTNDNYFLRDYTSERERRFWIMECNGVTNRTEMEWKELVPDDMIEQLWAEALEDYNNDASVNIGLTREEMEEEMRIHRRHKSYGNDPKALVKLNCILESRYTPAALTSYKLFAAESIRSEYEYSAVKINKVEFKWIVALIDRPVDYVNALVLNHGGWHKILEDGVEFLVRDDEVTEKEVDVEGVDEMMKL